VKENVMTDHHSEGTTEPQPLSELLSGGRHIAMVMTIVGDAHTSRPVTCLEVQDERLSFLVGRSAEWVAAIEEGTATTHLTVADKKAGLFLSLNGSARVSHERQDVDRLWNPYAAVDFDSPPDPEVAVLQFVTVGGHYWESADSKMGRAISLVRAAITHEQPDLGSSGAVMASPASLPAESPASTASARLDPDAPGASFDDYSAPSIPEPNEPG
jgi:general stress protein 26